MAFYLGPYLVENPPEIDRNEWQLPITDSRLQHARETSNPEDLNIKPEDITLMPEEVQAGCEQWGDITFSTSDEWTKTTHPPDSSFYGFYILSVPASNFYILTEF